MLERITKLFKPEKGPPKIPDIVINGQVIPLPPADLLAEIGDTPEGFRGSLEHVKIEVSNLLEQGGVPFQSFRSVLDWGCGLGRFLLAMQPIAGKVQKLYGAEVSEGRAKWCQQNLPFAKVVHNGLLPPLAFEANQFDLLYALSVFTHLRVDLQFAWAAEVERVLMPGGVAMFSTHGPSFFSSFMGHVEAGQAKCHIANFGDTGTFVTLVFGQESDEAQGQIPVATAHHPDMVRLMFPGFELVRWFPRTILAGGQDMYLLRKPKNLVTRALPVNGEVMRRQKETDPARQTFRFVTAEAHTRFSCFVAIDFFGDRPLEMKAKLRRPGVGGTATEHTVALNANRVYGAGQYLKVDLPLAVKAGELEVELEVRGVREEAPKVVTWLHPACYSAG